MAVQPVEAEAASQARLLSLDELRAQLQATGEERYHHKHPFHLLMHEGKLNRGTTAGMGVEPLLLSEPDTPIKDAIILSLGARIRISGEPGASESPTMTATLLQGGWNRALAYPGRGNRPGLEGGARSQRTRGLLPAVRYAVDAYLNLVRQRDHAGGGRVVFDRIVRGQTDLAACGPSA